jgi:hypothetical protein
LADVLLAEGGVGEYEVEAEVGGEELVEGGEDVLGAEFEVLGGEAGGVEVLADEGGVARGDLDGDDGLGAAAEGLEAEGAGAGEQLEDAGVGDAWGEAVEEGLFDEVRGGADGESFWDLENPAAGDAADDAHG